MKHLGTHLKFPPYAAQRWARVWPSPVPAGVEEGGRRGREPPAQHPSAPWQVQGSGVGTPDSEP